MLELYTSHPEDCFMLLWQAVKILVKCHVLLHFIWIYIASQTTFYGIPIQRGLKVQTTPSVYYNYCN